MLRILLALTLIAAPVALKAQRAEDPRAQRANPPVSNYALVADDVVAVKVFREPTLDAQYRISKDGTITFPFLGVVKLAGNTTNQAADLLARLLDKDYIVNPQVSVSVVTFAKQQYTVMGQVNNPGSFQFEEGRAVDLLAAIAAAGGFTRIADEGKIIVRRQANGQENLYRLDARAFLKDKNMKAFAILPEDVITVGQRFF